MPESYKVNKIKIARIKGEMYTNYIGKSIPEKTTGPMCRCKEKCMELKFDKDDHNTILKKFHSLNTKDEQDLYLQGLIEAVEIKNNRVRNLGEDRKYEERRRSSSFIYNIVNKNGGKTLVCKAAFLNLHSVSAERIRRLQKLLLLGVTPRDKRGHQNNQKTIPSDVVIKVMEHINKFPVKISHYSTKPIKYLDCSLSVTAMYNLFKTQYPDTDVKYSFYYKVFKESFGYRFGRPQIDACCECERLSVRLKDNTLNPVAKRVAAAELLVHKRRSNKFYSSLRESTSISQTDKKIACITFDYMQNIAIPCIPVQEMYYYRQLSVFPFGIHHLNNSMYFVYHEGIAKKGPNEVCSFLQQFLSNISSDVEVLHLYSDNCAGQNKNHTMIRFLLHLTDKGQYKKIIYRLPIRGHSFLPNDRHFALVKKTLNKHDRYTIKEVAEMILSSTKDNKFLVTMVENEDILNFKDWWPLNYKKNSVSIETARLKKNEKEHFKISKYHEFVFDSDRKGVVVAKEFVNGLNCHTFVLNKNNASPTEVNTKAYTGKCPILEAKIKDLEKMLQYIPNEKAELYRDIIDNWPTRSMKEEDE